MAVRIRSIPAATCSAVAITRSPQVWLGDLLRRIADHSSSRIADLLAWNWKPAATLPLQSEPQPARPSPDRYDKIAYFSLSDEAATSMYGSRAWFENYTF